MKSYSKYIDDKDFIKFVNKVKNQFDPSLDDVEDQNFVSEMENWTVDAIHEWEDSNDDVFQDGWLDLPYAGYRNLANSIVEYIVDDLKKQE